MPCNEAVRDPDRLLSSTNASEYNSLTYEHLDEAERKRRSSGAHDSNIAMSGRDLQFGGRCPVLVEPSKVVNFLKFELINWTMYSTLFQFVHIRLALIMSAVIVYMIGIILAELRNFITASFA